MTIELLKKQLSPILFDHNPGPFGKLIYEKDKYYGFSFLDVLTQQGGRRANFYLTVRNITQTALALVVGNYISKMPSKGNLLTPVTYTAAVVHLYLISREFDFALTFPTCAATLLSAWKIVRLDASILDKNYIKFSLPFVFLISQMFWYKLAYPLIREDIKGEEWIEILASKKVKKGRLGIQANLSLFNDWLRANPHINLKDQLNLKDPQGNTFLHYLNFENVNDFELSILKEFLKNGLDLNTKNNLGQTPLHTALLRRDWKSIQSLIELGANVKDQDKKGNTIYHLACHQLAQSNDPAFYNSVLALLNAESLTHKDKKGNTIFHHLLQTVELNRPLLIDLIRKILNKVKSDQPLFQLNNYGKTPLMILVEKDQSGLLYDIDPFLHDPDYDNKFLPPSEMLKVGTPNPFTQVNPRQHPRLTVLAGIRFLCLETSNHDLLKCILRYHPFALSKGCHNFLSLSKYRSIIAAYEQRLPSSTEWFQEEIGLSISNYPLPKNLEEIPSVTGVELKLSREKLQHMLVNVFFLLADLFNQVRVNSTESKLLNYINIEQHGRRDGIIDVSWKHYLLTYRKGLRALFKVLYERQNILGAPIAPSFGRKDNELTSLEKSQREELNVYFDNRINQLIHITSKLTGWSFERLAQHPNSTDLLPFLAKEEDLQDFFDKRRKENTKITYEECLDELLVKNKLVTSLKAEATQNPDLIMQRCSAVMDFCLVGLRCGVRYESDFFAWYRQLNGETPDIPLDERVFRFLAQKRLNFFDIIVKGMGNIWGIGDISHLHNAALALIGKEIGLLGHSQAYKNDVCSPWGTRSSTEINNIRARFLGEFDLIHTPSTVIDLLEDAVNGSKSIFGDRIPRTKIFPFILVEQWLKENIEKFIPFEKRVELEKEASELFNEEWQMQNPHKKKQDEINKYVKESYYWSNLYKDNLFTREAIKAILLHLRTSEIEKPYLTEKFNLFSRIKFEIFQRNPYAFSIDSLKTKVCLILEFEKVQYPVSVRLIYNDKELSKSPIILPHLEFFPPGSRRLPREIPSQLEYSPYLMIKDSQISQDLYLHNNKGSFFVLVNKGNQKRQKYKVSYEFITEIKYGYSIVDEGEVFQDDFSDEKKSGRF